MSFSTANFNQTASWQNWWRFSSVGDVQHGQNEICFVIERVIFDSFLRTPPKIIGGVFRFGKILF
jgi:hypothetical protein